MKVAKWIANFIISTIILLVTLYLVISICVGYLMMTNVITVGQPMYFDLQTPSWGNLLIFQSICVVILVCGFFSRHRLKSSVN